MSAELQLTRLKTWGFEKVENNRLNDNSITENKIYIVKKPCW